MKLLINYDLIARINQSQENYKTFVLKNSFQRTLPWLGICMVANSISKEQVDPSLALTQTTLTTSILFILNLISYSLKYQVYGKMRKAKALKDLKNIIIQLNDSNINTTYDLLLKSRQYKRKYQLYLNEKKLPQILQKKYIMIPINHSGKIKETSIMQQHTIGSNKYILSLGYSTEF